MFGLVDYMIELARISAPDFYANNTHPLGVSDRVQQSFSIKNIQKIHMHVVIDPIVIPFLSRLRPCELFI
jgi:hypothetical protein